METWTRGMPQEIGIKGTDSHHWPMGFSALQPWLKIQGGQREHYLWATLQQRGPSTSREVAQNLRRAQRAETEAPLQSGRNFHGTSRWEPWESKIRHCSSITMRYNSLNHTVEDVDLPTQILKLQTNIWLSFADLYEDDEPYNAASYTLFGYLVLRTDDSRPEKMLFSRARGALKGWSSRSPQAARTGADRLTWYLLGLTISEVCPPAATAMLLQLDTYARPTEILQLCRRDITKPASRHCKFWGVIFGNSEVGDVTKTGTQDDTVLLV